MLKKISRSGEYTNLFIMMFTLVIYYVTPSINFADLPSVSPAAPFGAWIENFINTNQGLAKPINIVLIIAISWYLNIIATSNEIVPRQTTIIAGLLPVFMLFTPVATYLTSTLVATLLLTYSFHNVLNIGGKQNPILQVLNATMAIAFASMIIPFTIAFIMMVWFGFLTFSVNTWRDWVISIIGLLFPYLYLLFAFLWDDNLNYLLNQYSHFINNLSLVATRPAAYQLVSIGILVIIFITSMLQFVNDASDKIITIRKRMGVVSQFAFVSIILITLSGNSLFVMLPIFFVPLIVMFSYSVHNQKRTWLYDILLLLLIVSIMVNRLIN